MAKGSQRHILVVDDSSINRDMLSDFIELLGHEASTAENGQVGLLKMASGRPDVVLLDIDMPIMTGIEVLEAAAEDETLRRIPIIVISGRDDMENISKCIALGATDFLSKPFNPTILEARLISSIEKKDLYDREHELLQSLEKSYADLKQAEQSRDALTHMIVHDLGNPLAVISMNTDLLHLSSSMGMPVTPEALAERLRYISSASQTMGTMIQSMLDVSKLESGQMPVQKEETNLFTLLSNIIGQYTEAAAERGIQLHCEGEESASCVTDPVLLERIVSNLLSNAFKYATSAQHIILSVSRGAGAESLVTIADDGEEIPEAVQLRIFDKFYQIHSKETGVQAGVGLGLAFCKMAAGAMGGSIRVESVAPHGTRFVLSLP